MATITPASSLSVTKINPTQRSLEIKAEQAENLERAEKSRQEFEESLAAKETKRPANPASRIGRHIDVTV